VLEALNLCSPPQQSTACSYQARSGLGDRSYTATRGNTRRSNPCQCNNEPTPFAHHCNGHCSAASHMLWASQFAQQG
ncbi:hypothetical protein SETIT_1G282600v2, partial [Setaria italica]